MKGKLYEFINEPLVLKSPQSTDILTSIPRLQVFPACKQPMTVYNRGRQPTCDNSGTQRDTRWHMSNRENCILTYIFYSPQRAHRSSNQFLLTVPRCRCKTKGGRAFSAAAPKLWNSLPVNVRLAPSLASFKSALKSYLFSLAFE